MTPSEFYRNNSVIFPGAETSVPNHGDSNSCHAYTSQDHIFL